MDTLAPGQAGMSTLAGMSEHDQDSTPQPPARSGPADAGTMRPGPWDKASARARARRRTIMLVALTIVGGFAFATVLSYGLSKLHAKSVSSQLPRPSGIPAGVSTALAYRMQLSTVPTRQAPDFTLTDQNGDRVSMAGLRGKVVVLTFMDPHCTDICPLVSREFLDARKDLGRPAGTWRSSP